jgi:acetolactate synthase-1/2/3 large subunit
MGLGGFPGTDPRFLGMLGMHGTYEANMSMQHCDVLIAIGARFDDRVIGNPAHFTSVPRKIIHIDIDPSVISKRVKVDVPIVGNLKEVLIEMIEILKSSAPRKNQKKVDAWWSQINEWRKKDCLKFDRDSEIVKPQYVVEKVYELTNGDAFVCSDVGQHQMWAAQYLNNGPRQWISSSGLGTMGFGLPAALGAQTALEGEQVICVAGDASVLMNIQELGTLAQYQLPVKLIIINNGWQGMVRQWQESFYEERYSASDMSLGMPDFPALAEAFGVRGISIVRREDLRSGLQAAFDHPGPVLVDVRVRRNENCYPMVPPGKSNAQMVGLPSHPELALSERRNCSNCGHSNPSEHIFCSSCGDRL